FSRAVSVPVTEYSTVERLRDAAKEKYFNSYLAGIDAANLKAYASSAVRESSERGQNLAPSGKLGDSGSSADNPLIIQVPKVWLQLLAVLTTVPRITLPLTEVLKNSQGVARGCLSVADWNTGTVHNIPLIWNFMSNLGGCTDIGEIFWRLEDKQAVFQLEDGWFRESSLGNYNAQANKKSILVGSSGIGKSTLLCLMAFYLVF
ncbi:hypothetical protein JG688_00013304, partial [Phytophthora aleatoria]